MKNAHAKEYLKYYLSLENPQFAVLIDGKWGCGKTWFVKDILPKEQADGSGEEKGALYVSLYGLESTKDIEDEFYRQLHPVLSSKPVNLGVKILKGALKATIKLDIDGDGRSETTINTVLPDLNHKDIDDFIESANNRIVVFDDLERCPMDINVTLGYINTLVEHLKYNVVIISNEEQLVGTEDNDKYKYIREKLVGKTLTIEPDVDSAIDVFISEVKSDKCREYQEKNKNLIKSIFYISDTNNLRQLRKAIIEYSWLYDSLPSSAFSKEDMLDHVISLYLALSFEYATSEHVDSEFLRDMAEGGPFSFSLVARSDDEGGDESAFRKIKAKYTGVDFDYSPINYYLWMEIFLKGLPDKESISLSVESSNYYPEEMNAWRKLWHRYGIDDTEFEMCLSSVREDLEKRRITDPAEFFHIAGLLIVFSDEGLISDSQEDVKKKNEEYISWLISNDYITHKIRPSRRGHLDRTSSFNLGYSGIKTKQFSELWDYHDKELQKGYEEQLRKIAAELLEELKGDDLDSFAKKTVLANSSDNLYYDIPVLSEMPAEEVGDQIIIYLETGFEKARTVIYVFENRWKNFQHELFPEKTFLSNLKEYLLDKSIEDGRTLSRVKIQDFIKYYVDPAIDSLEKTVNN